MTRSTIHDKGVFRAIANPEASGLKGTMMFVSSASHDAIDRPVQSNGNLWKILWYDNSMTVLDSGIKGDDSESGTASEFENRLQHRYLIGEEIGCGGMGNVYLAWDVRLQRKVAVKIIKPEFADNPNSLRRFFREARIASGLSHPGIVPIYEFAVTTGDQAFIVMGLLQGRTLRDLLDRVFDWDAEQPKLLSYFLESAQAIAYAHAHGVIHRDITPSNIIAGDFGVVCVLDWGLAKILDRSDEVAGLFVENDTDDLFRDGSAEVTGDAGTSGTLHGSVLGTPSYISPEQARGELDLVDRRSDVFGLGGVLCEILTGQAPFVGDSPCEIYSKASRGDLSEAFERLESCRSPRFLVSLAKRCLAPNPADRPSDAGAVVRELIDFREAGQHRAEQDLIRFFDLTLDLLCIANLDGYFCRVNQNFTRLLGYSESELTSKRFLEFVHPEDREKTTEEMRRLSKGEPTIQFLNRYRHVDGRYLWLEWSARSVPIESAVYAVARDVTDRIQTTDPNRNRREENARVEQNGDGSKRPRSSRRQSR